MRGQDWRLLQIQHDGESMMFGHPSQHSHMMSGVQKALKSSKTPAHLRPHLEARMAKLNPKAGYNPKTAAKPQNSPGSIKQGAGGPAAQSQLSGPPAPFQNARGSANIAASKGAMKGVGNAKTANSANIAGSRAPSGVPASPGNPFPKKRSSGAARSKFYGG